MFGSRSVSLNSMLEVLNLSINYARSGNGDGHHILEGVASDAAIVQMALWMSKQDSLPQAVREKARKLYEDKWNDPHRAFDLLDWQGYVKPSSGGSPASPKSKYYGSLTEGNAIQYTFMIAHDVLGLQKKIDDAEKSSTALLRKRISDPSGGSGAYRTLRDGIKAEGLRRWDAGERSMALRFLMHFLKPNEGNSSWYAFMGNEVAHSSPFLANWFEPHLTQNAARRISLFGFRNTAGGLFGNDDLGATSAWYVWTAMGIYPVIPGIGGVTLVAPSFEHVEISVPGGKSVQLRSSSERAEDAYIQSVRRDGLETSSVWLTASDLLRGVELDLRVGSSKSTWGQDASDRPPSYGEEESGVPAGYGSIWREEGDDATSGSSHLAFDGDHNTAWRFVSESDGSKVLEVDFTSVYAAKGLLLRHADVGRTSTLNNDLSSVTVSIEVKDVDGNWNPVNVGRTDHDTRRMLWDFGAQEMEIHGLRLTFGGLDVNEEHGIYEVLAKDGSVKEAARLRSRRSLLEKSVGDDVSWIQLSSKPVLFVGGPHEQFQVAAGRTLVLGESHISVKDLDTRVSGDSGDVDDSKITLRVRDIVGGELQRLTSSSPMTWTPISPTAGGQYREFSLEDLRAGKIRILAGDGTTPITFTIQAVDDGLPSSPGSPKHLSDSDPDAVGDDPAEVEIVVLLPMKVVAGNDALINADHALTPNPATLGAWKASASAYSRTLHVVVKMMDKVQVAGDTLSLRSGYDASKVTPSWTESTRELSLRFVRSATPADIRAALGKLSLDSTLSLSSSTRKIWVFPTFPGLNHLKYRLDESADLVRYYYYDGTDRSFSAASTEAEGRTLFGKGGYLGVYTSDTEKSIYTGFNQNNIFLAISDEETEGKWLVTSGPRKGQLFWDDTNNQFGPGAAGSGWSTQRNFWHTSEPNGGSGQNYAELDSNGRVSDAAGNRKSVTQFDLLLSEGGFLAHELLVVPPALNPVLEVDFSEVRATSERYLVLEASRFSVTDFDTVLGDVGDGSIDPDKIKLRITNLTEGRLYERSSDTSDTWTEITSSPLEFSLRKLWDGLIALRPNAGISALTFDIQAVDDQGNLSDSDESDSDFDPFSVSISVIALKEIAAGKKTRVNDDGALTPDGPTLDAWRAAATPLTIFVKLYIGDLPGGKRGIVDLSVGDVTEHLSVGSHNVPSSRILVSWSNGVLSLEGTVNATTADFMAILNELELQTVHFEAVSYRTIEVEAQGSVGRATYYVRDVEVSASPPNPLMKVDFGKERMMSKRRLVLNENHIEVYDLGTVLGDGSVDASNITLRVTNLSGGKLEKFSSNTWTQITSSPLEFTLEDLRNGLVSFLADSGVSALTFDIQAVDPQGNLSDSDETDTDPDPVSVEVPVIALKEIDAGKKMPVNKDHALTPDDTTLGAWITADNTLTIFVELKHGKRWSGARTVVQEQLLSKTHSVADSKIAISWDADNWKLVLEGSSTAAVGDFKAVLEALELQTVRFATASDRTISVRPDLQVEVDKQDYTRDVLVRASGSRPYVGEQEFFMLSFGDDDRAILLSSEFFVEDFDSSAADITIVMTELLAGATLQKSDNAGSYSDIIAPLEFTLAELQQGLIAIYMPGALGKEITFELKAKDEVVNNWNDIGTGNTYVGGVRAFELDAVLGLSSEALEVDVQTGYQRAVPFGGLKGKIETVRGETSRDGALRITLENATSGDRLVMRKSVAGITGAWSDQGHVYTLTVSDTNISSEDIDTAVSEVYYRASEVAGEQVRRVLVHWVDNSGVATAPLYEVSLYNRPPVLRNWGVAARYHDITPAPGGSEAPLDLGYHPFREYVPEILDNEGRVVRLEVVLVDKAGDVLSADERVFLSKLLREQAQAGGLVVRELRSSDRKALALVVEVADEKTFVSPVLMSQVLQGLLYRHGPSGVDVGERREISVAVFDGQAYSHTRTMEVRLVDETPDPAKYVNTFIGTAEQKRMGVAGLAGNVAGMTFPGASYPFGMVKFSPDSEGGRTGLTRNGGYRRDEGKDDLRFGLQYLSGPGCAVAGVGQFKVGVSGRSDASDDWSTSDESSSPGYYQVGVKDGSGGPSVSRINVELTTGSARTGMMRLTYNTIATGGWIDFNYVSHHTNKSFTSISSVDDEWIVQYESFGMGTCEFGYTGAKNNGYWMQVSFHIKKDGLRNLSFSNDNKLSFDFAGNNLEVLGKVSMSYVSKANARENVETEAPGWDFEAHEDQGRKAWNYYLSKVAINDFDDADHDKDEVTDRWSVFYSALYRSLLHMDVSSDVNGDYRTYDDSVRNLQTGSYYDYGSYDADTNPSFDNAEAAGRYGPAQRVRFTNFSGWDVYRSQMALVGLLAPAVAGDMAQSLVHSGVEWGSGDGRDIPRWTAGEKEWGTMKGDPGPPSVSSLYFFSQGSLRSLPITLDVFDYTSRWKREHYTGGPRNPTNSPNIVMEGMASDAAISQFAFRLSQMQGLSEELRKQAWDLYLLSLKQANDNLGRLMDGTPRGYPNEGLATNRNNRAGVMRKWPVVDGAEGNPIQYGFMPNHDVKRLEELIDIGEAAGTFMLRTDISSESTDASWNTVVAAARGEGNKDEVLFLRELQVLFNDIKEYALARWDAPNNERSMAMRFMMHFMDLNSGVDGTMHAFLSNEVQHAVPYLGNWFEPHLTQDIVRRALNFGFRNADWGLYGNDDLGATSSFYVWGALGIYPVIPGVGGVTLVAPSFAEVDISLPDGRSVKLLADEESMRDRFVRSMTRDGRTSSNLWISAQELLRGTELDFDIGTTRSTWGEDDADAPPSYRTAESATPPDYASIWREEGDDATGASSHSAFDGDHNTAWRFVSGTDGSKVLEVDFTSVYAASGLLLRHADVGRTSTLNSDLSNVAVSVSVKDVDGNWNPVTLLNVAARDYDTRRMLLTFDAEAEMYGLRLTFAGLDVDEEHGIYEVLAKDGSVKEAARLRSRRSLLETTLDDDVTWVSKADADPRPLLFVDGLKDTLKVGTGSYLVLGEEHILVDDADTRVSDTGDMDASEIKFRVRNVVGGELRERSSAISNTWTKITETNGYQEFSLADLRAGKIGFLAGDSEQITFTIQAMDDQGNLSDSDPTTANTMEPADGEILVAPPMKSVAGYGSLINADGGLMPDTKTLNVWMEGAQERGTTLHVIVKVLGRETGDVLSLKGGSYDASKIRPVWDATEWDATEWYLSLEILAGATVEDIQAALRALWLETELSDLASTRKIVVFPTLPGLRLSGTSKYLRYRVDETRGLVRYHLHDRTLRTAPAALAAAAGRSLFGKKGYMAFPTSAGDIEVYKGIADGQSGYLSTVHAGLSDEDTEGQWVIMDGPRQGQVLWDHSTTSYGPGAEGSGLRVKNDLWYVPHSRTRYPRTDTTF